MRGAANLRRGKQPPPTDRRPHPPPTPTATFNPWQQFPQTRDSDASFASSRPSSVNLSHRPDDKSTTDRSTIATINNYISTTFQSLPPIKTPLSIRDIEVFKHLLMQLGFPISNKIEDDINIITKSLNCPIKFNKSALRAPGERRASAMLIALIHWLVQLCQYSDNLNRGFAEKGFMVENGMFMYVRDSYGFYMREDDESVVGLDEELIGKLESERDVVKEENQRLEEEIRELVGKVEELKGEGGRNGKLEEEKAVLEEDVKKFEAIIEQFEKHVAMMEKVVEDKEKELEVKVVESRSICEENEEIKKKVEEQLVSSRDADRMKRELVAVERDVKDAEAARSEWEEKGWNLGAEIGNKLKELEERVIECNQATRRLKLGPEIQYQLNTEGSTPAEVLGIDYKNTLKPTLAASIEDVKRAYVEKCEELISLKKKATESASRVEAKRSRISTIATQIKEVEAQLDLISNETQDYTSRCSADAQKIAEDSESEISNMVIAERDAAEHLKVSEAKLVEAIIQTEEKEQLCAQNLFAVVDSVSKFKEHVALKILEMKTDVSETAVKVADAYKYTAPAMFQHVHDKRMLME